MNISRPKIPEGENLGSLERCRGPADWKVRKTRNRMGLDTERARVREERRLRYMAKIEGAVVRGGR